MSINIEEITSQHNRKAFDCGVDELNQFLQQQARQKIVKHIAKTYVAYRDSEPTAIMGYHTLTGYSVTTPPVHKEFKKYPHPLSAVKLARLAVDHSHQGQRLGERLLIDVDCINDFLNREPLSQGKAYIPSISTREAKKLETLAMYQDWKDAYIVLNQSHPDKSKSWCSLQIAKMDIAKSKDAETIRKNMIK